MSGDIVPGAPATSSSMRRGPELPGQTVVVIGGSAGIGLETTRRARAEGATILIAAGFVDTPLSASLLGDQLEQRRNQLRATLPILRVVGPADVAALALHRPASCAV